MSEGAGITAESSLAAIYGPRGESIVRQVAGEWFLVPIRTTPADFQAIFTVNEIGALIWDELDGTRTLGAVLEKVLARFDVARAEAATDLLGFLAQLEGAGLVERKG